MKKLISCLAILTMLAATASCGVTESGGTSVNIAASTITTSAAETTDTTTAAETSASGEEQATAAENAAQPDGDNGSAGAGNAGEESAETELVLDEADRLFGGYVATDGDDLNLRNEPFPTADIIATIPNGTQLDIYSCGKADWYCTRFNGKSGYVSADYIRKVESYDPAAGSEAANKYGYFPVTEQPQTSIAVSDLTGTWYCGEDTINFHDCSWGSGKFEMKTADKTVQGNVYLEYSLTPDNLKEMWYNLYDNSGEFVIGFHTESGIQLTDIYAGQSGDPHYTRPLE